MWVQVRVRERVGVVVLVLVGVVYNFGYAALLEQEIRTADAVRIFYA